MAMRATASHDIRAEGLRVPRSEALVAPLSTMREGQQRMTVAMAQRRSWGGLGYHLRRMAKEVAQGAMRICGAHAYVAATRSSGSSATWSAPT
jgi:alkylation response protein AidB-like acyl-CoA dehydrogenase